MLDEMLLAYGKKFIDQWQGVDTDKLVAHWARELSDFTGPEIRKGLDAMDVLDWPPSLPQFKKLCRPPIDNTVAYYEALNGLQEREAGEVGKWSHPAIYWAAVKVGAYDFKTQSYSQLKARWEKTLSDEMEKGEWATIPRPLLQLAAPGKGELSKEKAKHMLAELGATGIVKSATGRDEKRWAKKILQRESDGDKSLTPLQVRFAREALNVTAA